MSQSELNQLLILGGALFSLGLIGFLTRRSLILMFLSLETMLAGVSLNLIAFSRLHQNYQGQVFAIMVLTIAACEAAIALAIIVALYRQKPTLDVAVWDELHETSLSPQPEVGDIQSEPPHEYPKLITAGLDPLTQPIASSLEAATNSAKAGATLDNKEGKPRG